MPEMPEIETIRKQLDRTLKGKKIERVLVRLPKMVKPSLGKFKKTVTGAKIRGVKRRAKLLLIELSNENFLAVHLKLSGQLIFNGEIGKHTRLVYYFTDGSRLVHNDLRKFGFVKLISKKELGEFLDKKNFGPEPLSKSFSFDLFKQRIEKRKKSVIKTLLMNQSFISGIGNIYACEILFCARIFPNRKIETLKPKEIKAIYNAIKKVLSLALRKKGASDRDYVDAYGKEGGYMPIAKVYQREGDDCLVCGT
ncbi:MAG: bifunctional DNA-formamidopyrimidine glycosylase/DNA-(apurinic or apyrimidinic site) lyase, partial [Patescibacteria group bacterium]|nr:bifunctional DNA-formamidopyrimidine glycosylase/DNA-(apurinic or apyrimidinic site) lyase [Patescibacteria group bacterium]